MNKLAELYRPLNEFFDHIYVITIRRATERHEKITRELNGLHFTFLYGADHKEFSIAGLKAKGIYDEDKAIKLHRYGKTMNSGMLGCTISHKMVYEDITRNGYKKSLIFEDDIIPRPEGLKLFPGIIEELPGDWELLYFDYNKNIHHNLSARMKQLVYHIQKWMGSYKFSHKIIDNLYARTYSAHLKRAGYHDFGSAYAVTLSAAEKLVRLQTPVAYWSDHLLAYVSAARLVNAFITFPKLFEQESQFNKEVTGSYAEEV